MVESSTKDQILNASVKVLAAHGPDMPIAEIAAAAGVNVSNIYHYFKNKEDLLFHTSAAYTRDRIAKYQKEFVRDSDPDQLLKTLLWEQLRYHSENENYARFAVFECRSNRSFIHHEAFSHFLKWSRIMRDILTEGCRKGVFFQELPIKVARDMIHGLLDISEILYFTGKSGIPPLDDYNGFIDLLLPMLHTDGNGERTGRSTNGKRDSIVLSAETFFAKKGFAKATTIELAKTAGVAEKTLYDHFGSKEDILFSTLQDRLMGHIDSVRQLFDPVEPLKKLSRFICYSFTIYLKQPAFIKTFVSDGIFNPAFYRGDTYKELERFLSYLEAIIEEGKASGDISKNLNNRLFKYLFLGIFSHTMLRWQFAEERKIPMDMASRIHSVAELMTRAAVRAGTKTRPATITEEKADQQPA